MAATPAESRDHLCDLRSALEHAVRLLSYSAGREAATDPTQSARLLAAVDDMKDVLARTAP
ncbi:hypothetical protein [Streptomyces sp. SID3343]|uniref:hypothetical protein n=1 Tax=Streptomyces sp. SID3343 TaxID=2690260 RepID=UPI001368F5FB|nr:hypothetical protein [Streptomyces sp. SID3343]MYW04783.1 hypothetical protein [Streptomyces sp. SID3343]